MQLYDGTGGPVLASAVTNANGYYALTTNPLQDGSYHLAVTATDVAGNVSKPCGATMVTVDTA